MLFAPFDVALEKFYRGGGAYPITICTPVGLLRRYRERYSEGSSVPRYMNVPVELAEHENLSVRGKTNTGAELEVSVRPEATRGAIQADGNAQSRTGGDGIPTCDDVMARRA